MEIKTENSSRGQKQTAYQVLVASNLENLENDTGDVWNSGKVKTNQSVNNTYQGNESESAKKPTSFKELKIFNL